MNKWFRLVLPLLLSPVPGVAAAQIYLGVGIGGGDSNDGAPSLGRSYTKAEQDEVGVSYQGFVGYRYGWFGVEAGAMHLPTYRGYAEANDPPRSASQEIKADAIYARAMAWMPEWNKLSVYGFVGVAKVSGRNHEIGGCSSCGHGYVPDFRSETNETPIYYGGGVQYQITERLSARAEYGEIPSAVDSHWAGDRKYRVATVGLALSF